MQKSESSSSRIVNIVLAIILILFASLAAPKLPKSMAKYLENPWIRFAIFVGIAYLATKDLVTSIIAVIAVSVSYQTLSMHKITDTVMNKTTQLLNNLPLPAQTHSEEPEPVVEEPDAELHNKITTFTKELIKSNPGIDKNVIISSLSHVNPNVEHSFISNAVDNAIHLSDDKMAINDNEIAFETPHNYYKKNTIKYLQDNTQIPNNYEESNILLEDIEHNHDTYTTEHINNYNYGCNEATNTFDNSHGFDSDFENYGLV
jgi:hypothetical protein